MGKVYWITGLSGAGKTTIGKIVYEELKKKYPNTVFLDGDTLREVFGGVFGYEEEDRRRCAMCYARLCAMLEKQDINVVCCTISMFHSVREWNREHIHNYREIYVKVSMEELVRRNQKGLYSASMEALKKQNQKDLYSTSAEDLPEQNQKGLHRSTIENKKVAGVHVEIEEPKNSDMILDNEGNVSIAELVDRVIEKFGI